MSSAITKLPKPQLRRLAEKEINRNMLKAGIGAGLAGLAYYLGVTRKHQKQIEAEAEYYNADKEFERLRDLGFFMGAKPKDPSKALYNYWERDSE